MVKKAFFKTTIRMFVSNKARFIANFFIVFLSVAITSGLGGLVPTYNESFATVYKEGNAFDIDLKTKVEDGFSDQDINKAKTIENLAELSYFSQFDLEQTDKNSRIYFIDFNNFPISTLSIDSGDYPSDYLREVVVERSSLNLKKYEIGDLVDLDFSSFDMGSSLPSKLSFEVTGVVHNSIYNSVSKERANFENEEKYLNEIIYIDAKYLALIKKFGINFPITDIYLRFNIDHNYLSESYDNKTAMIAKEIESLYGTDKVKALTLKETTSYGLFSNYGNKITRISYVFPFFFIVLCMLVNVLIITRLIKDERSQIGCFHSIGVSKHSIVRRYVYFSLISTILGAAAGYICGTPFIPKLIYNTFCAVFYMGPNLINFLSVIGIAVSGIILLVSCLAGGIYAVSYLKETPSALFRPQTAKPGKKIILEKISLIWSKLKFSYKSSLRNIFRQKKNFVLTTMSIMGSTLLVLIGFGLLDVSGDLANDSTYGNVAKTMSGISFVIVAFALLMSITVIYALTSMNISDRVRELATLKVLGYNERECSNYAFREILIIAIIAVFLGLPMSTGIIAWVLEFLGFGNIGDLKWYSYVLTVVIIIASTYIVNILLKRKIRAIDMNGSLKSIE